MRLICGKLYDKNTKYSFALLSVTLYRKISGRPMVTPSNKTITAVYGQPLTLTMEFCANPPYNKVFWIAKNKVYIPGDADKTVIAYGITVSILVRKLYLLNTPFS